ncbi:Ribosomal L1 domain-containing protein 1 [Quaeritorhiza haematococci]|nr:Ribosomal L1 domain-containing protein 1 [Quaeritorhiza haematococci]
MLEEVQVAKAVKALTAYIKKKQETSGKAKTPLFEGGEAQTVWLIVGTKQIPDEIRIKPQRIPLKFPIIASDADICLITKDPQREFKTLLEAKGVTGISKVIGVSKLRTKYKPYETRRQLCSGYDLFLADDRVLPLLPPILGKVFFEKKKHPVPVDMTKTNLQEEFKKARSSTYLHLNRGCCNSVRIGLTTQEPDQIVANIMTAIGPIVDKIPRKWSNIQSINIKTNDSIALPIFNVLPDIDIAASSPSQTTQKKRKAEEEAPSEEKESPKKKKVEAATKKGAVAAKKEKNDKKSTDSVEKSEEAATTTKTAAPAAKKAKTKTAVAANGAADVKPKAKPAAATAAAAKKKKVASTGAVARTKKVVKKA